MKQAKQKPRKKPDPFKGARSIKKFIGLPGGVDLSLEVRAPRSTWEHLLRLPTEAQRARLLIPYFFSDHAIGEALRPLPRGVNARRAALGRIVSGHFSALIEWARNASRAEIDRLGDRAEDEGLYVDSPEEAALFLLSALYGPEMEGVGFVNPRSFLNGHSQKRQRDFIRQHSLPGSPGTDAAALAHFGEGLARHALSLLPRNPRQQRRRG
ncbi:MAG: hypothetical protein AABZ64_16480 [Nitrospinota bacterium]